MSENAKNALWAVALVPLAIGIYFLLLQIGMEPQMSQVIAVGSLGGGFGAFIATHFFDTKTRKREHSLSASKRVLLVCIGVAAVAAILFLLLRLFGADSLVAIAAGACMTGGALGASLGGTIFEARQRRKSLRKSA